MMTTGVCLGPQECCYGYMSRMKLIRVLWWLEGTTKDYLSAVMVTGVG